ncbi:hypothetical protein FNF31_07319 [Cafeteria roenbergensis]|uniref:histidine kinase n=1 Tax=Cafeteria roenbergensis TaxID=33653 RepID=A0A5A8C757_CAFRO|nr:hypothetical protein FNF31_07319 [Cafeteria roenbergensis]
MVTLVVTGIDTRGCDEWRAVQAAAPAGSTWPDGLDLSGSQALRDRVVSVGTLGAVIALCILAFAFIPSVSMVLELQSSVAHVRSEQSRMQSDALVRAMTYVSHHARGPLNAAVLCMAVLEADAALANEPASARGGSSVSKSSHVQMKVRRGAYGSPSQHRGVQFSVSGIGEERGASSAAGACATPPEGFAVPAEGLLPSAGRASFRMQHSALYGPVVEVPSMADGDFGSVPSSGSCTPTLSSSSIMRDLQIALESSKQELDDLLLWQRLSAKDSSSLMSWGAIADSSRGHSPGCGCEDCRGRQPPAWFASRSNPHRVALPPSNPATPGGSDAAGSSTPQGRLRAVRSSWAERPPSGPAAPSPSPSPSCFGVGSAGSGASEATHDAPGAAFPWAVYTDHARVMQAAVAMVAIGTYAAATRSSRSRPGHVCVSVSVSTGRRALSGLGWSQQSAPRRGMRGSERGVLCVEVRFTGQGYSAAELDGDPFDPFGRLRHGDESLRLGSSGLRLAVVRGVASSLEGEAGLASGGEDCGAHLWLRVPVTVVRRSSESWAEHVRRSEGRGAVSPRATMASRSGAIATSVSALVRSVPASPSSPAAEPRRSASNSMGQRRRSSAAVLSARSPTNRANAPLSGWRVWVADDDPTTARVSALVVRRSGAATRTFADGAQLVAAVEAALDAGEAELEAGGGPPGTSGAETGAVWGLPDGVLVDGSMPVLGGVDAIRAIVALGKARAPWWEPRLWLVTGDVTAEAEAEALRAGADGMLRKPVTGAQLVDALLGVADSDSDQ